MTRLHNVAASALLAVVAALPAWAQGLPAPKYSAKIPSYITTPDSVDTRIGTLKFFDGLPDPDTVKKVYDNLDFSRGVEAFLSGMPAASVYAACEGLSEAGVKRNGSIGIMEELMDAKSLFLTANSTTVYVLSCMDLKDGPVVVEVPPGVLGPVDDAYFRFVEDASRLGVTVPIVPGIMPITNYSQMMRFSEMCGAEVPRWVAKRLEGFGDDREAIRAFGLDVVTALCERLLAGGAPGLHFYTLNAASATKAMWQRLGL